MAGRTITPTRIKRVYATLKDLGLSDRGFDIRVDGVTVFPLNQPAGETAYDARRKRKDALRDASALRQ